MANRAKLPPYLTDSNTWWVNDSTTTTVPIPPPRPHKTIEAWPEANHPPPDTVIERMEADGFFLSDAAKEALHKAMEPSYSGDSHTHAASPGVVYWSQVNDSADWSTATNQLLDASTLSALPTMTIKRDE